MFRSLGQIIVTVLIVGLVLIAGGIGWFLRSSVEDSQEALASTDADSTRQRQVDKWSRLSLAQYGPFETFDSRRRRGAGPSKA